MNLLTLDSYFDFNKEGEEKGKVEFLAKKLVNIWSLKLKNEFPEKEFIVESLCDEDEGD